MTLLRGATKPIVRITLPRLDVDRGLFSSKGLNQVPAGAPAGPAATAIPNMDGLEKRQLLSVSLNSGGFSVIAPETGDRVVYVSSSAGSDTNSGLVSTAPFKTLTAAKALIRAGTGDQLLLKRGDTWRESLGVWVKSGKSATNPLVIGAYGSGARPVIATGTNFAITTGSSSSPTVSNLAIVGVKFYADTRDPANAAYAGTAGTEGVRLLAAGSNTLIEDVEIDGYTTNLNIMGFYGTANNVVVRRSVIADSYNTAGHSEGLYAESINGLTLEDNVLDHNGWNTAAGASQTIFNHNAYVKESVNNFIARGNLFSNAGSHGLQARAGGIIENNTFLNNPIGLSFGLVNSGPIKAGGVSGRITNNVFLGGPSIAGSARGWGIEISNTKAGGGTTISGNVFAGSPTGSGYAINVTLGTGITNSASAVGVNDLTIEQNVIYDWSAGLLINNGLVPGGTGGTGLNGLVVRNNDFQRIQGQTVMFAGNDFSGTSMTFSGNRYDSAAGNVMINYAGSAIPWTTWSTGKETGGVLGLVSYPDPTRNADTYAVAMGLGTSSSAYVAAARKQSASSWTVGLKGSSVANYVRGGFGFTSTGTIDTLTIDLTPPSPPSPPTSPPPPPVSPPPPPTSPPPPPSSTSGGRDDDREDRDHRSEREREAAKKAAEAAKKAAERLREQQKKLKKKGKGSESKGSRKGDD